LCVPTENAAWAVTHVGSTTPPTFLANSTDELATINQLTDMHNALTKADISTKSLVMTGNKDAFAHKAVAYCPTVRLLSTYLGPIQGSCTPPAA
jgi:hypothetical protein